MVDGDLDVLTGLYRAELGLLAPIAAAPPPTEASVVTNFHRCNIWFPRSARDPSKLPSRRTTFLDPRSIGRYWTELCKPYDHLGEFPQRAAPPRPTTVPILAWVGDLDIYDHEANRLTLARLSSRLEFEVMKGWAHDLGPDSKAGFRLVANKIRAFIETK